MAYTTPTVDLGFRIEDLQLDNLGAEQVSDWDMAAVGTGSWSSESAAVLSKQSNGEGGQCLRVAWSVGSDPGARQTGVASSSRSYSVKVRARSDGSNVGIFYFGSEMLRIPAAQSSWETYEFNVYSAPGTTVLLQCVTTGAGYSEFDIVSVKEWDARTLDRSGNGNHGMLTDGLYGATFPGQVPDQGMDFTTDGAAQVVVSDPLGTTSAFSITCMCQLKTVATDQEISSATDLGANQYYRLRAAFLKEIFFYTGTGLTRTAPNQYTVDDQWVSIACTYKASTTTAKIYLDGVLVQTNTSAGAPVYNNQDVEIGQRADGANDFLGTVFNHRLWDGTELSAAEVLEIHEDDRREMAALYV